MLLPGNRERSSLFEHRQPALMMSKFRLHYRKSKEDAKVERCLYPNTTNTCPAQSMTSYSAHVTWGLPSATASNPPLPAME